LQLSNIWGFVTDFGDSAVTVPLALLVLVFLLAGGHLRGAFGWVLAIGGCAAGIAALKLAFGACGHEITFVSLISPSGHTAMSTAIYGSLALLVGARLPARQRSTVLIAATLAIVAIAVSRVVLHDHSRSEVAVGFIVGAAAVAAFRAMLKLYEAPVLPLGWLLLSGGILVAALHGTRWMIEPVVHRLAWDFRLDLPFCR
jgi:membrane-associated phospholipid phosphatase